MDTDVLIVGAGPTGLMLANQLARRGTGYRVVDRNANAARESRALGVQAGEAYRRLLEQKKRPIDARIREQLETQIARIEASEDPARLEPLRNPWLE